MSHIATESLSDEMEVSLQSEELVLSTGDAVYPDSMLSLNKQETLKLKDFLNREV